MRLMISIVDYIVKRAPSGLGRWMLLRSMALRRPHSAATPDDGY